MASSPYPDACWYTIEVLRQLGPLGPSARDAVPALTRVLEETAISAERFLGVSKARPPQQRRCGPEPREAANLLGEIGSPARAAGAALVRLLELAEEVRCSASSLEDGERSGAGEVARACLLGALRVGVTGDVLIPVLSRMCFGAARRTGSWGVGDSVVKCLSELIRAFPNLLRDSPVGGAWLPQSLVFIQRAKDQVDRESIDAALRALAPRLLVIAPECQQILSERVTSARNWDGNWGGAETPLWLWGLFTKAMQRVTRHPIQLDRAALPPGATGEVHTLKDISQVRVTAAREVRGVLFLRTHVDVELYLDSDFRKDRLPPWADTLVLDFEIRIREGELHGVSLINVLPRGGG